MNSLNCGESTFASRVAVIVCMLLCQLVLAYSYEHFISPRNTYMGLVFSERSTLILALCMIGGCIPALFMPIKISRIGDIVIWYIYIVLIMPFWLMGVMLGADHTMVVAAVAVWAPLLALMALYRWIRPQKFPVLRASLSVEVRTSSYVFGALALLGGCFFLMHFGAELTLKMDVGYIRRMASRESIGEGNLTAYLFVTYAKVLLPIALVCALVKKSPKSLMLGALFGFILVFSITGQKISLLLPISMLWVWIIMRFQRPSALMLVIPCTILLVFALMAEVFFEDQLLHLLFTRRVFCVPQLLSHAYIEHFTTVGFLYFTDLPFIGESMSVTGRSLGASYLVGEDFFGKPGLNANAGAITYGYAEAGIIGSWVIMFASLTYMIAFEWLSLNKDPRWVFPLAMPIATRFAEQSLHTAMISGGLVGLILAVALIRDRQYSTVKS